MSLRWFRKCVHLVLLGFVLLVGGLGTDLVTVDRVDAQELDVEAVAATPSPLDLSSPFASTELDPPLAAEVPVPPEPFLIPSRRSLAADGGPLRIPDHPHPPPRA